MKTRSILFFVLATANHFLCAQVTQPEHVPRPTYYFVVGSPQGGSSGHAVVPVTGFPEIAWARELAKNPNGLGNVVNVKTVPFPDLINRNYQEPGAPYWSWSAVRFKGFSDISTAMTSPRQIEANLEGFTHWNHGGVGFVSILGELPLQPGGLSPDGRKYDNEFNWFFDDQWPWYYLIDHGWWYIGDFKPHDMWVYSMDMGWLWTAKGTYPWLYRSSDETWIWYVRQRRAGPFPTGKSRWFFNSRTNEWEEHAPPPGHEAETGNDR